MNAVRITRDNWGDLLKNVNDKAGREMPIWQAMFNYYSVCLPSLVTPLSTFLWSLYNRLNAYKHETYESYMAMPVFISDSISVIEREIERIEDVKRGAAKHKTKGRGKM